MSVSSDGSESDSELARRWQAGDGKAAESLVDRHLAKLRAFLATRCGNVTEADDLTQEVFLAACRQIASYRHDTPFSGWIYAIARNKAADFWRRKRPTEPFEDQHAGLDERSPSVIHAESDGATHAWSEVFVHLPEAQATALWLRVQQDMDLDQIAATLGVSYPNAKVMLFRARQSLAQLWNSRAALS